MLYVISWILRLSRVMTIEGEESNRASYLYVVSVLLLLFILILITFNR
jgi:hypothetical protein